MAAGEELAHLGRTPLRREPARVDAAGPDPRVAHLALLQLAAGDAGGAQVQGGLVVEPADVAPERPLQEPEAVAAGVAGQVGVVGGDQGHPGAARAADPGDAEEERIEDVDQVRAEGVETAADVGEGVDDLELGIEGQGEAADADDLGGGIAFGAAAGREEDRRMPPLLEVVEKVAEGVDDAVDLGQEGLGKEGDAHGGGGRPAAAAVPEAPAAPQRAGSPASASSHVTQPAAVPARVCPRVCRRRKTRDQATSGTRARSARAPDP